MIAVKLVPFIIAIAVLYLLWLAIKPAITKPSKLCKNCSWHAVKGKKHVCIHPSTIGSDKADFLVEGNTKTVDTECKDMRSNNK